MYRMSLEAGRRFIVVFIAHFVTPVNNVSFNVYCVPLSVIFNQMLRNIHTKVINIYEILKRIFQFVLFESVVLDKTHTRA
jgi:hypothetical protein